jgi:carboxymethylenebutenolidase
MPATAIDIKTRDGVLDATLFTPDGPGPSPAVIFYMDAIGVRPTLAEMAARIAGHGYAVLLPNLYYRSGRAADLGLGTDFADEKTRDRVMAMFATINPDLVTEDTRAMLAFLEAQPTVRKGPVGSTGYCMGGFYSLSMAGRLPDSFAASASFHGANLASDQPASPHLRAKDIRAEIYVGVAEIDPFLFPDETARLKSALEAAGTRHTIEIYPGVQHGFAVPGMPVYDRAASERHFDRLLALLARALKP